MAPVGPGKSLEAPFPAPPTVLTLEPTELFALGAGRPIAAAAGIAVGLVDLVADRLGGGFKLPAS